MNCARTLGALFFAGTAATGLAQEAKPCRSVWEFPASGVEHHLLAVASVPGGWVVVGEGGTVLASADGKTWERISNLPPAVLRGVAWGEETLVVVGDDGLILAGPNPRRINPVPQRLSGRLNAVAWGAGFFVAGGAASENLLTGVLLRSPDGFHWEDVTPRDLLPVYGIYASEEGFHAVGWNGSWVESADGAHWTVGSLAGLMHACTFMLRPSFLFAVAASLERTVATGLVVGDQYPGVGVALSREAGAAWECTVTEVPPHPFRFYALARSTCGFLAAGLGGVAESQDGRNWQPELELAGVSFYGVAAQGETWVAVGEDGLVALRTCEESRRPRRVLRPVRE